MLRRLYDPVYRHWFRVEWEGLEHLPAAGGALLVANHAGEDSGSGAGPQGASHSRR
ncbi:MAG TPA: hypothetical protein VKV25_04635 [Acidimicrobiales bacterium]|nr:hypothetical protein [Acidimicrobiales bacterium]